MLDPGSGSTFSEGPKRWIFHVVKSKARQGSRLDIFEGPGLGLGLNLTFNTRIGPGSTHHYAFYIVASYHICSGQKSKNVNDVTIKIYRPTSLKK